jgi:hypothetical protein
MPARSIARRNLAAAIIGFAVVARANAASSVSGSPVGWGNTGGVTGMGFGRGVWALAFEAATMNTAAARTH